MAKTRTLPLDLPDYTPDFSFEDRHSHGHVCGIDEAGRGPLAGPVVAAAVIIRRADMPLDILAQINDSKKLTAEKREYLFKMINQYAHVSVGVCSVEEIDRINILQASLLAMRKAHMKLKKLVEIPPVAALIDGNMPPKLGRGVNVLTIVKGDARSYSIAAASIIAKHHRDEIMIRHAKKFPQYGWITNAGYGTPEHLEALEKHGVTPLHRRSFAPVSNRLDKQSSANN